jgi:predicted TIM-barrel fold metal-dependent hydrolase
VSQLADIPVNPENRWRVETPAPEGWARSVRPDAPNKYFMVSCDAHLTPPPNLLRERIDERFRDRLPRIERNADGVAFMVQEGMRPSRVQSFEMEGEDLYRSKTGNAGWTFDAATIENRLAEQRVDGVDAELVFPNGAPLLMWSSDDHEFVEAQCRIYNDWAMEVTGPYKDRCNVAAAIPTSDLQGAIAEVEHAADLGYRVLMLPCKPIWGPHNVAHLNYNLPHFDPLWSVIQDVDMPIVFHVSTGMDPRLSRGNGGAVINYAVFSLAPTAEPVANLCASGVIDRFPNLKFATIEANAGWVPWFLQCLDEAYLKHHFWVRPKLERLPSDYYRTNGASSLGEDQAALDLVELHDLGDNFMWANDYPHHEGSWPHSAEAIEREMTGISETTRAKILGLNAARFFKFDIPPEYRDA